MAEPGPAWVPGDLGTDLLGFWDAEDVSTFTLAGSNVSAWRDKVASYSAAQGVSSAKPIYSATSFGGRPGVKFDGTDDLLRVSTNVFGNIPIEVWMLIEQFDLASDAAEYTSVGFGGTTVGVSRRTGRRVLLGVNRAYSRFSVTYANDGHVDFSGKHVVRSSYGASNMGIAVDGQDPTTVGITTSSNAGNVSFGASTTAAPTSFAEINANSILFTKPLSVPNASKMLAFLKSRGGIS